MNSIKTKYHGTLKLKNQAFRDYLSQVERYMEDVLEGRVSVCRYERLAVQRHVNDLQRTDDRYYFSANIAAYHVHLFPALLTHQTGGFKNKPFYLCGFQAFIVWVLFGWRRSDSKMRRFKEAYLEFARKNGKTAFAAGVAEGLTGWDFPHEARAESYFAATKEAQAKLCWDECWRFIRYNKEVRDDFKILTASHTIRHKPTDAILRYEGCDGTTLDGLNPSLAVFDELHEWKAMHRTLMEKLQTGSGMRQQPLFIYITTAGHEDSEVWLEERSHSTSILDGTKSDDQRFAMICAIDPEDDPFLERQEPEPSLKEYEEFLQSPKFYDMCRKANPTLGEVCRLDSIQDQCRKAFGRKEKRREVLRYQFNRMVSPTDHYIAPEDWKSGDLLVEVEEGDWGCGGVDLARSDDFAAASFVFPLEIEEDKLEFHIISRSWTCRETSVDLTQEPFLTAIREGNLVVCEGDQIDYSLIRDFVVEMCSKHDICSVAYDPAFARETAQILQDEHQINVFYFGQSPKHYNEPMRNFRRDVKLGKIVHGGEPLLAWQANNLIMRINAMDQWMPDKRISRGKIDAMVATLMAYSECKYNEKARPSFFRGNFSIKLGG